MNPGTWPEPMNVADFAPTYAFRGLHSDGERASWCDYVHDGDTPRAFLVLPCWTLTYEWLRIRGIKAPELHEPGGPEARDYLSSLVLNQPVWVRTFKRATDDEEKRTFARLEADIGIWPDAPGHLVDVAVLMARSGLAEWVGRED